MSAGIRNQGLTNRILMLILFGQRNLAKGVSRVPTKKKPRVEPVELSPHALDERQRVLAILKEYRAVLTKARLWPILPNLVRNGDDPRDPEYHED